MGTEGLSLSKTQAFRCFQIIQAVGLGTWEWLAWWRASSQQSLSEQSFQRHRQQMVHRLWLLVAQGAARIVLQASALQPAGSPAPVRYVRNGHKLPLKEHLHGGAKPQVLTPQQPRNKKAHSKAFRIN
jgi:hypothetical protein